MPEGKVFLKMAFIFDPAETWSSIDSFNADFSKFFDERGLEAEVVKTAPEQEQIEILYIKKKDQLDQMRDESQPQQKLKVQSKRRDFQGRFKKEGD